MKAFTLILSFLALSMSASLAQAGYACEDQKNNKLTIEDDLTFGTMATLTSPEITEAYKPYGIDVKNFQTVIDPETGKAIAEGTFPTLGFMMYAPNSGTDTVWGLGVEFKGEKAPTAKVTLGDQEGRQFVLSMSCSVAPALK